MAKCSLCGSEARGAFCDACGAPVAVGPNDSRLTAQPAPSRSSAIPLLSDGDPATVPPLPEPPALPKKRPGTVAIVGGATIALVAIVVLVGVVLGQRGGSGGSVEAVPAQTSSTATWAATVESSEAPAAASEQGWSRESSSSDPYAAAWPSDMVAECSTDVAVNEVTSCPFALNVASGLGANESGSVSAYSPATGQWYDMSCTVISLRMTQCTGGRNAVVFIRQ